MDESERKRIVEACRDLVIELAHLGDHGEHEKAIALWTEDGTWIRGGKPFTAIARVARDPNSTATCEIGWSVISGTVPATLRVSLSMLVAAWATAPSIRQEFFAVFPDHRKIFFVNHLIALDIKTPVPGTFF